MRPTSVIFPEMENEMQADRVKYGLRSRSTGKLVRLDRREYHHEIEGTSADEYLTFDDGYPFLQEEEIGGLLLFRYGQELVGRPSLSFYRGQGVEIEDLEVVEYVTTHKASPVDGGDPSLFGVEICRLEFDIVSGVNHQYVGSRADMRKKMLSVFSAAELAGMQVVPSLEFVVLKSKDIDLSAADLAGSIITPSPAGRTHALRPLGVVDARSVDGVTYAVVSQVITDPCFRKQFSLVDGFDVGDQPWEAVTITFSVNDGDETSELFNGIWNDQLDGRSIWPNGWSIGDIDVSGPRPLVVFNVEGAVREVDGRMVRRHLDDISVGIDPRLQGMQASNVVRMR